MSKKVVLIGGAGAPNYGDELIVKGWIDYLSNHYPNVELTLYENIRKNEIDLHGEYNFLDDLVKVAKAHSGISFWNQVKRGYHFIENDGISKYAELNLQPLLEANIIILHGGGYLNNYDPEKGFFIGLLAAVKKKYDINIYASGIGFGPVPQNNLTAKDAILLDEVFSHFDSFELRDVDNFRALSRLFKNSSFIYGTDDSYLIPITQLIEKDDSKKRLHLSFLEYNLNKFSEKFWSELISFSQSFDEIYFIESYPWQDRKVFEFLKKKFIGLQLVNVKDMIENKVTVGKYDFACCSRFHVHYLFARSNIQGIYFQDSQYYDIKHQSILDRGSMVKECGYQDFRKPTYGPEESYIALQDVVLHQQKIKYINDCLGF